MFLITTPNYYYFQEAGAEPPYKPMWNALVGASAPAPALRFAALCAPTRPTLPRGVLLVLCKQLTLSARASPGGAYPEAHASV